MKFRLLVATMALALGAVSQAAPITLNFEGIAPYPNSSNVLINNFYNGGTSSNGSSGTNYGVQFTSDAVLLCLNTIGTTCSNTSKGGTGVAGSDRGAMYFLNANPTMNVAAGFDTGFAMAFSNPFAANTGIEFWTGLDATGVLITSATLGNTTNGTEGGACSAYGNVNYCPFANFSTTFAGTAHSVRFTGGAITPSTTTSRSAVSSLVVAAAIDRFRSPTRWRF